MAADMLKPQTRSRVEEGDRASRARVLAHQPFRRSRRLRLQHKPPTAQAGPTPMLATLAKSSMLRTIRVFQYHRLRIPVFSMNGTWRQSRLCAWPNPADVTRQEWSER